VVRHVDAVVGAAVGDVVGANVEPVDGAAVGTRVGEALVGVAVVD